MKSPPSNVPPARIALANQESPNPHGDFVLYWMVANRRAAWNYSLDRALDWAEELGKPLVVLEALRSDYRWASDRLHRFVIQGMVDNLAALDRRGVFYYPYLEPQRGAGSGLFRELAARAAVVVSDDFPCFFLPAMLRAARRQATVRMELVDSNGLLPMRSTDRVFARAVDFRRHLQKTLTPHLAESPQAEPFKGRKLPAVVKPPTKLLKQWPAIDPAAELKRLDHYPIDHSVGAALASGGTAEANRSMKAFLADRLPIYHEKRSEPETDASSGLSPYLHFGHLSVHEVFAKIVALEDWNPGNLAEKATASARGWWGMSEAAEGFLDELITWRELGYNRCALTADFDRYESLPEWAQATLAQHANDPRPHIYRPEQFERSETHDPLWNAAQRQLVREGRMQNYLRMLWGKKILEWSATPRDALGVMIEMNNRYALDGRNPNSYSGIFWVLGRYDRAWGPERPIFGKIRYMSSDNTARKFRVKNYLAKYHGERELF